MSEQRSSAEDELDDGSLDFIPPWRRHFFHSDVEHSVTKRDNVAYSSSGRPASTPGNFSDVHWLPPLSTVDHSRPEAGEKDSNIKKRIEVWISRLDRLISDSSLTDQSLEFYDVTPELFSSQDTVATGSSSLIEYSEEDEDYEDEEQRDDSSCVSLDEVLREAVCHSTFESNDCLMETESEKPFQEATWKKEAQSSPKFKYYKGTVCSDISQACEILNTRYKLEDITVRKPVITWSKWNVSQVVRGPDVNSPIWNPTLKRNWGRPNSIVFQELNKDITRRNEELEQIVRRKTGNHEQRSARPLYLATFNPLPPPTSSISPPSSIPLPAAASSPSVDDPPDPLTPRFPLPPCRRRPDPAIPPPKANRSSFIMLEISPQITSRTDPGGYPHVAMTTDDAEEDAGSSSSAGAAAASFRSSSSSAGMSLLRRMVKSFWNIFLGDGGCHGEAANSSSNHEADSMSKMPMPKKNT